MKYFAPVKLAHHLMISPYLKTIRTIKHYKQGYLKYMTITTDRSYYWLINTAKKWRLKAKKSRILMENI